MSAAMNGGLLRALLIAFALWLAFAPDRASAATCTATITDVDFGAANLLSTGHTDAMATVNISCTGVGLLLALKMCPSIAAGSGGSSGAARLFSGPGTLRYGLYQDASRTTGWGSTDNTTLGTIPLVIMGGNLSGVVSTTLTVYARLFGSQTAALPGSYSALFAAQTSFTYDTYLLSLGATSSCVGFVGGGVVNPNFTVRAAPPAYCKLSANDLAFGSTGVLSSAVNAQTTLTAACTRDTVYAVSLDNGTGIGATVGARKLTAPAGGTVNYGLYRDAARGNLWGGNGDGLAASGTGNGGDQAYTVYGRIPAQATPAPGSYTDRIVVTVSY